jgi:hypothetical protein
MTSTGDTSRYRGCMGKRSSVVGLLLIALVAGCAGGSSGDPGVLDFISIDPPKAPLPPSGGSCESVHTTHPFQAEPAARDRLRAIAPGQGLWLDIERGAVVDVSAPDAIRVRSRLELGYVVDAVALDDRRVIAGVQGAKTSFTGADPRGQGLAADQLVVLGFDDPDAPAVLARATIPGDIVYLAVHRGEDARASVHVVSDEVDRRCIGPTKRSFLLRFGVDDDALSEPELLELGGSLAYVSHSDERLVLLDWPAPSVSEPLQQSMLRFVSLDGSEPLAASAPIDGSRVGEVAALSESDDVLTLVAAAGSGASVVRIDVSDDVAPRVLSECTAQAALRSPMSQSVSRAGERYFTASGVGFGESGSLENHVLELNTSCEVRRERQNLSFVAVPDSDTLIELDWAVAGVVEARLVAADGESLASARVELPAGCHASAGGSVIRTDPALWSAEVAEPYVLAVPVQSATGLVQLQLFSFSDRSISVREAIASEASVSPFVSSIRRLALPLAHGFATLGGGAEILTTFGVDTDGAVVAQDAFDLAPRFDAGTLLDDEHLIRLRRPAGWDHVKLDAGTSHDSALEVVKLGTDPEHGAAVSSIAIGPHTQVVQAGKLWLAIHNDPAGMPGETTIAVHDLSDPERPRARGVLKTDALWLQDNEGSLRGPSIEVLARKNRYDGSHALTTERAVVFRGYTWVTDGPDGRYGHSSFTFHVVDLSDPDAPKLGPSFAMPREDHAYGASVDGSMIYYRYKRPLDDGRVRFFVRQLDVSTPSAAKLSQPIVVPGELLAVRGDVLITRELVREGGQLQSVLHRVRLDGDRAHVLASRNLGDLAVDTLELDGERVLVDIQSRVIDGPQDPYFDEPPPWQLATRLIVLDAASLETLAEGEIGWGASRLSIRDDEALYSGYGGLLRVDVLDPGDHDRQELVLFEGFVVYSTEVSWVGRYTLLFDANNSRLRLLTR